MRKAIKAKSLGYDLMESEIRLLYFVWAKCDLTSYCSLLDSGTCYADSEYQVLRFDLEAKEFLESDVNDPVFIRLSDKGRKLIMELGM